MTVHANPEEPALWPIIASAAVTERPLLTEHQRNVAAAIGNVLRARTHLTASVLGMTSTGKTRILLEIAAQLEKSGRKTIVLSPNTRLAGCLDEIEFRSIYRHLYLDRRDRDGRKEEPEKPASGKSGVKIPLLDSADPDDCVYLVDDAHLLGNSIFLTLDGKTYGSGRLLSDLFEFADLSGSSRQLVFFADPYQIQRSSASDSVIDGSFQAKRDVSHIPVQLEEVIDAAPASARLQNARTLVEAMQSKLYSSLDLVEQSGFRIVDATKASAELLRQFQDVGPSSRLVTETHAQVSRFNGWLRPRLFGENPGAVEAGELLEVYRAYSGNPLGTDPEVRTGRCYRATEVGPVAAHQQSLSGRPDPVEFRLIDLIEFSQPGSASRSVSNVLVDYLAAEKPEVPAGIAIALRVWANAQHRDCPREDPGPAEDTEDAAAGSLPVTLLRYGYASTVHHAQGNPSASCFINGDFSGGRHSDAYFRWLYTALTTSFGAVTLFNFTPLHPVDSAQWNMTGAQQASDITIGSGWSFVPEPASSEPAGDRTLPAGIRQSRNLHASLAVWSRLEASAISLGWAISEAEPAPYREKYKLTCANDTFTLMAAYNGRNRITAMHVDDPDHWDILCDIAARCLQAEEFTDSATSLFAELETRLVGASWRIVSATESAWLLRVTLARMRDERVELDVHFDRAGLATTFRPLRFSNAGLLDELREILG